MKLRLFGAAMVAAGLSVAGGARQGPGPGTTLHLVEKDYGFNYVDTKPIEGPNEAPTIGDMIAFTARRWTKQHMRARTLWGS
jgi:hypothetical protein